MTVTHHITVSFCSKAYTAVSLHRHKDGCWMRRHGILTGQRRLAINNGFSDAPLDASDSRSIVTESADWDFVIVVGQSMSAPCACVGVDDRRPPIRRMVSGRLSDRWTPGGTKANASRPASTDRHWSGPRASRPSWVDDVLLSGRVHEKHRRTIADSVSSHSKQQQICQIRWHTSCTCSRSRPIAEIFREGKGLY